MLLSGLHRLHNRLLSSGRETTCTWWYQLCRIHIFSWIKNNYVQECRTYLCQLFVEPEEYPRIFPNAIQEQKIELAALGPWRPVERKKKRVADQVASSTDITTTTSTGLLLTISGKTWSELAVKLPDRSAIRARAGPWQLNAECQILL